MPGLGCLRKRVQEAHFHTLSTSPTILHWDSETGDLAPWKWPVDAVTGYRVTPSELEAHRRTHHFLAPSCLCASLFNEPYIESRIGLVHVPIKLTPTSSLSGEYTAECATGRCGYLVCLERFYVLPVLQVKGYPKREIPLPPCKINYNTTRDICQGLQQAMPIESVQSRGIKRVRVEEPYSNRRAVHHALALVKEGISKDMLYNMFIECFLCRRVVLKCAFPHEHHCPRKLKFQYTELDDTRPLRHMSMRLPNRSLPRSEDDLSTDIETEEEDTESDEEINEILLS
ncbi:hypothetical protein BKA70DRAFT_1474922 [Coprinopsis sp. MPI-PUGE-AT-0042]|nr:hypothetical protein BKA70DRAFT_1474922 [Coprinopsis sp. MPI-PUGE-AT-0042]